MVSCAAGVDGNRIGAGDVSAGAHAARAIRIIAAKVAAKIIFFISSSLTINIYSVH